MVTGLYGRLTEAITKENIVALPVVTVVLINNIVPYGIQAIVLTELNPHSKFIFVLRASLSPEIIATAAFLSHSNVLVKRFDKTIVAQHQHYADDNQLKMYIKVQHLVIKK